MNTVFKAGASRADTTPAVGGMLYGYNDNTYSTSLHDNLELKALCLSQGDDAPILMLSLALADFGTACSDELRRAVSEETGVPFSHILCSTTHTHSAPNCAGQAGWGENVDRPYFEGILIPAAIAASKDALASCVPAEFAVATGESFVGVNRRQIFEDGHIDFGQNTWGVQDKTMTVIRFRNKETKEGIFQMIHYGCHGTASGNNTEITRDWIGVMTDRMETEYGIMTGFWNGSVGDTGPRIANGDTIGDIHHAEELGGVAAIDAVRIARTLDRAQYESPAMHIYTETFTFPCRPLPPKAEIDAYLASHPRDIHYVNIDALIDTYMVAVSDIYENNRSHPTEKTLPVTVVTLGDSIAFCPVPYEVFSEICLRLRLHAPHRHALLISLTNGYESYLPTKSAIPLGGYEVESFCYIGPDALADDTDTALLGQFLRVLRKDALCV